VETLAQQLVEPLMHQLVESPVPHLEPLRQQPAPGAVKGDPPP